MHDEIAYEGPGRYYLTDGQHSISLGMCSSRRALEASARKALNAGDADWDGWRIDKDAAQKATIVKGNRVVATADTVGEAKAYAAKVGGKVLVPAGGARRNGANTTDSKVISAFLDHRSADSKKLSTDGRRLDGNWMGGYNIARWGSDDKIHFEDLGSRAAQTYQRAIVRAVPKNWIAK